MKKLSAMLIAISFCIISGGNAVANNSQMDVLDRHAVWDNWFDENGKRITDTMSEKDSDLSKTQKVSTESDKRGNKGGRFSFIRETEYYDHSKDKGPTA